MTIKGKSLIFIIVGSILLVAATAGANIYVVETIVKNKQPQIHTVVAQPPATHTAQPVCNDDNVVGKIIGAAAGGIAGSQVGSGSGKTAATIGGAIGGSLLGEKYIPTQNATCTVKAH